ncbi:MAG TPA: hypothetical protein PKJ97_02685, partial [Candidatus Bilamarchaeaceae archaeon]|nr:hypothetical protein [Candidatus Bilamarchaeaceae archaeon]
EHPPLDPPLAGRGGVERRVLEKLAAIRFEKRAPALLKELSRLEREALMSLEKKGAVTLIKSRKYPNGVYNIQKEFYPQRNGGNAQAAAPAPPAAEMEKQLFRDGYLVVSEQRQAQELSDLLQKQRGAITGLKSFDGKYYVVTKAHMAKVVKALSKCREEDVDPKAVGAVEGMHPDGITAVLKILAEGGEYIEKGDFFIRVG